MAPPRERTSSSTSAAPSPRAEIRATTLAEAFLHGVEDMAVRHDEEVPSGLPLDIDWPQYRRLERAGVYRCVGAFLGGRMVGYSAFFVQPTLQSRSTVQAINDVLYLEREHRKGALGIRLITEAEPILTGLGARRVVYSTPKSTDAKLSALLVRLGYGLAEVAHMKTLQGAA